MSPAHNPQSLARGACPGISLPMLTGDGLLARLNVDEPIPIDAFAALCDSSQRAGNGIMEISRRGNLQFRGLSAASAPGFAADVIALGLGRESVPQIITSPLLGLDGTEPSDRRPLAAKLKQMLATTVDSLALAPKFSLLVDGGGKFNVSEVRADIRLRSIDSSTLYLSLAGSESDAVGLGAISEQNALAVVSALLSVISKYTTRARATDVTQAQSLSEIRIRLSPYLIEKSPPPTELGGEAIGVLPLNDGHFALGLALPFGFSSATDLRALARTAVDCGASHLRPAPGRVLLAIGMLRDGAERLREAAIGHGMIVSADDRRRFIVTCAGAPACASARMPTRELATLFANSLGSSLDGSFHIHLSGCEKGCAHGGAVAFTLTGPDRVIFQGRASDPPQGHVAPEKVLEGMKTLLAGLQAERGATESMAHVISCVGHARMLDMMGAETRHA